MRALELRQIQQLYFGVEDIANVLRITHSSAKVTAHRYAQNRVLIRLKKDLYVLSERFFSMPEEDRFRIANLIQTPSYVSLTSALSHYNVSTQQTRGFIESIALKRTKTVHIGNAIFTFKRIKEDLYNGFELKDGYFIAFPEKALADCVYLTALKRYRGDFEAVDFKKLKIKKVDGYLPKSNCRVRLFWDRLCENCKF